MLAETPAARTELPPLPPADLRHLVIKLRWMGLEDDAARLCRRLARLSPEAGVALWPMDTD